MCQTPLLIKNKEYALGENGCYQVPCGKCSHCIKLRCAQWTFRLKQERKASSTCYFVTLTYDDDHLPLSKQGYPTLVKRDLQLYIKRLRERHNEYRKSYNLSPVKLTYYAVGEYGTQFGRPHYHLILFNCEPEVISNAWLQDGEPIGFVDADPLKHDGGLMYVVSYIQGIKKKKYRSPEFSIMSQGLGKHISRLKWWRGIKQTFDVLTVWIMEVLASRFPDTIRSIYMKIGKFKL